METKIKLYGTERCHKTQYYKTFFESKKLDYLFLDVEENKIYAEELRNLYTNHKLNFPTITIGEKKLRNPSEKELNKWLSKLS
ncbi:MAG: glutaredoxin family protein [Winogradskyella sp.]|uniref:glutaredoxin family protein n=1 Tax=Winogradskyella sp. TaxID=1883156 RepID=UPI00184797CC|nr:glutaredoxin domain-containing protein [Winogradskyella sp.]NNK23517.1 glutaredoxin family protein [Winogradskyella sp.]